MKIRPNKFYFWNLKSTNKYLHRSKYITLDLITLMELLVYVHQYLIYLLHEMSSISLHSYNNHVKIIGKASEYLGMSGNENIERYDKTNAANILKNLNSKNKIMNRSNFTKKRVLKGNTNQNDNITFEQYLEKTKAKPKTTPYGRRGVSIQESKGFNQNKGMRKASQKRKQGVPRTRDLLEKSSLRSKRKVYTKKNLNYGTNTSQKKREIKRGRHLPTNSSINLSEGNTIEMPQIVNYAENEEVNIFSNIEPVDLRPVQEIPPQVSDLSENHLIQEEDTRQTINHPIINQAHTSISPNLNQNQIQDTNVVHNQKVVPINQSTTLLMTNNRDSQQSTNQSNIRGFFKREIYEDGSNYSKKKEMQQSLKAELERQMQEKQRKKQEQIDKKKEEDRLFEEKIRREQEAIRIKQEKEREIEEQKEKEKQQDYLEKIKRLEQFQIEANKRKNERVKQSRPPQPVKTENKSINFQNGPVVGNHELVEMNTNPVENIYNQTASPPSIQINENNDSIRRSIVTSVKESIMLPSKTSYSNQFSENLNSNLDTYNLRDGVDTESNVMVEKEVLEDLMNENDDLKQEANKNNIILDFLSNVLEKQQSTKQRTSYSHFMQPSLSHNGSEGYETDYQSSRQFGEQDLLNISGRRKQNYPTKTDPNNNNFNHFMATGPVKPKRFRISTNNRDNGLSLVHPKTSLSRFRRESSPGIESHHQYSAIPKSGHMANRMGDPRGYGQYYRSKKQPGKMMTAPPVIPQQIQGDMMDHFRDLNNFQALNTVDVTQSNMFEPLRDSKDINPMFIGENSSRDIPHLNGAVLSKTSSHANQFHSLTSHQKQPLFPPGRTSSLDNRTIKSNQQHDCSFQVRTALTTEIGNQGI